MLIIQAISFLKLFAKSSFGADFSAFAKSIAVISFAVISVITLQHTVSAQGDFVRDREEVFKELELEAAELKSWSRAIKTASEFVKPSVVHLQASTVLNDHENGRPRRIEETGSGVIVIIEKRYFVLTNRHVVLNMPLESIEVHLSDHRVLKPKSRKTNAEFDFALLEIEGEKLIAAKIGKSDDVEIADLVIVQGSPFGLSWSVTTGIISARDRRRIPINSQPNPLIGFFQTDSEINPGNSGGPMLNVRGEVIGIVTAIASESGSNEGVAFAIPISPLMRRAEELIRTGRITRPYIGMELDPKFGYRERLGMGLEKNIGTKVTKINAGSPAAEAGILPGDVILRFEGKEVEDDLHLINLVADSAGGDSPKIVLLRNEKFFEASPVLKLQESR